MKSVVGLQRQSWSRKLCTEAKPDARAARAAGRAKLAQAASNVGKAGKKEKSLLPGFVVGLGSMAVLGVSGFLINDINSNPKGSLGQAYHGSPAEKFFKTLYENTFKHVDSIFYPSSDKLLPDWPNAPFYANVPPGTPCPPLLVLDLEKTLVGSTYDARFGWRHVKRPGLDKFLKVLSQYYEIVIFSENDIGMQV
jgi:hypothetical protein